MANWDELKQTFFEETKEGLEAIDAGLTDIRAGLDAVGNNLFQGFVDEDGIAHRGRCCCGQNKQPSRSNDSRTKRIVAGVNQKNAHRVLPFVVLLPGPQGASRRL